MKPRENEKMSNAADTKTLTDNLTSRIFTLRFQRNFIPRGSVAARSITADIKAQVAAAKEAGVWGDVRSAVRDAEALR